MAISKLTDDLNIISSLPDRPTLTSQELKEQFDKASNLIKKYINEKLTEEVGTELQTTIESAKAYVDELSSSLEESVNSKVTELETSVNNSISSVNSSLSSTNTTVAKKTVYGDITIEQHQVAWGGGQVYQGHSQTDASNTITKSGYYPIGVCSINTLDKDKKYTLIGQSKSNGSITVNYRWYHSTNNSIAPGDMPQSMIYVAWVKVR